MALTDEEAIERAKTAIMNLAIGNMRKSAAGGANLGAFILGSCIIDYLSCLYAGKDVGGDGYREFVSRFFEDKRYDPRDLWTSIRCGLVHKFAVEDGRFAYTHNEPHLHFKTDKSGRTYLNLEQFMDDIEAAARRFFEAVDADPEIRAHVVKRVTKVGIMRVFDPEF